MTTVSKSSSFDTTLPPIMAHALYYAETLRWAVFPAPLGEKKSHKSAKFSGGRNWGATRDPDEIRRDFERWPDSNIGIRTGEINGIFVVEGDTLAGGHKSDGLAALAAMNLPETLQAESPSGSIHHFFQHPGFYVTGSTSKLAPGVDVKGDGGMVLVAPSVKPGVGIYKWRNNLVTAKGSDWLLDKIKPEPRPERAPGTAPSAGKWCIDDTKALYQWLLDNNAVESDGDWVQAGMVARLEFGDDGLELWDILASQGGLSDESTARWKSFDTPEKQSTPNPVRLETLFKRAHALGWKGRVRESSKSVFAAVTAPGAPPLAPAPDMPLPEHTYLTAPQAAALVKFWAHLPTGKIIYEPTGEMWAAGSFDKHIGRVKDAMKTEGPGQLGSTFLSQHRFVKSMGWAPGEPKIIEGKVLTTNGWLRSGGDKTFNRYVPSDIEHIEGDVSKWLDHIRFVYPSESTHIVRWLAHRVQRPGDKVNHCLDFIGSQGIGKDSILAPVIAAIGSQNFSQITAKDFYKSEWNDYLQSVILRINEVHDLGGESRYAFYDATKDVVTNPPETHRINSKHIPQYAALNVCGVIMTSNHLDALYIPSDDRRHYVCLSTRTKEEFPPSYFDEMHAWFNDDGGNQAVAHYLANLDLSAFNAKSPPPKPQGWHIVVAAGLAPESGDLSDVIEAMGKPAALTLPMIRAKTPINSQLRLLFEDAKLRRVIPKRLAEAGYIAVTNPDARESGGRWRTPEGKTTIYARQELSEPERLAAARLLSASSPSAPA